MNYLRDFKLICLQFIVISFIIFIYHGKSQDNTCDVKNNSELVLPLQSGDLIYSRSYDNVQQPVTSILDSFMPQTYKVTHGVISPDDTHLLSRFSPDLNKNNSEIIVFARSGEVEYRGASALGSTSESWLQNNMILRFNWISTSRDSALRSYFTFSYYIVDFVEQTYEVFTPSEESVFYIGDNPIMDYSMTFDGRYMFTIDRPIFDFVEQKPLELDNFRYGVPSSTSHSLLVINYTSQNTLQPSEETIHPISVYDFDTDEVKQLANIELTQPVNFQLLENSWSPDESKWAYVLDWFDEIMFRHVEIFDLTSEETTLTCLGQFYTTDISAFSQEEYATGIRQTDFAWSRDGRYLALMAVVEGQDMEESFGLYLYDTQTEDIYLVHQGDADIIGWMAHPEE